MRQRLLAFAQQARTAGSVTLLAVDPGRKYVGLAFFTSPLLGVQPFGLLERATLENWRLKRLRLTNGRVSFVSQHDGLASVISELSVTGVVYGMPYHQDGSLSRECREAESNARILQESSR